MDQALASHRYFRRALWTVSLMPAPMLGLVVIDAYRTPALAVWAACYAGFLLALRGSNRVGGPVLALTQSVLALLAAFALPTTVEGAMLVTSSALLATRWPVSRVLAIAGFSSVAFGIAIARERSLELAVDVPLAWFGFQVFAALVTRVAASEAEARTALRDRNLKLLATRQLLAARSRHDERLRIARDLHDGLGHHLTALGLNLEAANHLSRDDAREHIARAQRVARNMLADVRETVTDVRTDPVDVMAAIRALAQDLDQPRIHVDGPAALSPSDDGPVTSDVADALLRLTQEAITNTLRHAKAVNLWVTIRLVEGHLQFEARDDGDGSTGWQEGHGLTGMRERLLQIGGSLSIASTVGRGFTLTAVIPYAGGPT